MEGCKSRVKSKDQNFIYGICPYFVGFIQFILSYKFIGSTLYLHRLLFA